MALIKKSKPELINVKVSNSLPMCKLCGKPFVFEGESTGTPDICPSCQRSDDSHKLINL